MKNGSNYDNLREYDFALLCEDEVTSLLKEDRSFYEKMIFEEDKEYWIVINYFNNPELEKLESIIKRRLEDGICDSLMINGRYTATQS